MNAPINHELLDMMSAELVSVVDSYVTDKTLGTDVATAIAAVEHAAAYLLMRVCLPHNDVQQRIAVDVFSRNIGARLGHMLRERDWKTLRR